MTTTVTVRTHDWAVEVLARDPRNPDAEWTPHREIPANSYQEFIIFQELEVKVRELPLTT